MNRRNFLTAAAGAALAASVRPAFGADAPEHSVATIELALG